MKSKLTLFLSLLTLFFGVVSLEARLGESRSAIEGRLLKSGVGIAYEGERYLAKVTDNRVPYRYYVDMFPKGIEHAVYFKKGFGDEPPTTLDIELSERLKGRGLEVFPEGWDIHVVYLKGTSIFESYRLNGDSINHFVKNAILDLNKGTSSWKMVGKDEKKVDSAFGYTHVLANGKFRALVINNTVIVYNPKLDETVFKRLDIKVPADIKGF